MSDRAHEEAGRRPPGSSESALDYVAFGRAVRRLTGVDLEQYRREQTERRVRALARRRGAKDLFEYVVLLRRSEAERSRFRDHVTINVSQLWRNPEHWQLLLEQVLPRLARERGALRAWSAGCSYGPEPYTLAMAWREVAGQRPLSIHATDIDQSCIERARRATFTEADVRDLPERYRSRWLEATEDGLSVLPALRRSIHFEVADIRSPAPSGMYDLVLCRNVVIYMTPRQRDDVHELLARSLRRGGWMMVGATERVTRPEALGLVQEHPFLYRKVEMKTDAAGA